MRFTNALALALLVAPIAAGGQSVATAALPFQPLYGLEPTPAKNTLPSLQTTTASWTTGSHRHVARGAVIGFVVGAIGGALYGRSANPGSMGRGYNEIVGAVEIGALGAAVGAIVGYVWRSDS